MQFNTYEFILLFMPIILIAYFVVNRINLIFGKIVLIIAGLVFYGYSDVITLKILIFSIAVNYMFSLCVSKLKRKRIYVGAAIFFNVFLLIYYKYSNFLIFNINTWCNRNISLRDLVQPIGISFYTFQQIAYIVSVYRGDVRASVLDYLTYILYFPKLLMGPLIEPAEFFSQLNDPALKRFNWDNVAAGIKLFSFGLFKKVLLADVFALAVSWGYNQMDVATSMDWFLIALFYTMEIYFDFSGYSDMAIGVSLMLNITLPINFNSPYKAISIRDFWKRWHISLTKFFTKYIYIPLGGSCKGKIYTCINILIVFFISGLWHGANWTFILWGIIHGVFNLIDRGIENTHKKVFEPARWLVTFFTVNLLWLLFRSESILQWKEIICTMFCFQSMSISDDLLKNFEISERIFITDCIPFVARINGMVRGMWMLLFICGSLYLCFFKENNYCNMKKKTLFDMILASGAFVCSILRLSGESVFIYFDF